MKGRRLVFVTQILAPEHPNLGYVVTLLRCLSGIWPDLRVIARAGDAHALTKSHSIILDWAGSRAHRARELAAAIESAVSGGHRPIVLAHQCPAFALTAWPVVKRRSLSLAMFYAHGGRSPQFRIAARLVDLLLTSTAEGCPGQTHARVIGQGIAGQWYRDDGIGVRPRELRVVTVGRVSPVKNLHLILDGMARASACSSLMRLEVVGSPGVDADRAYLEELRHQAQALRERVHVSFLGGHAPWDVARIIRGAFAAINLSDTRSLDKAILEAAASGIPVVTSNLAARRMIEERGLGWLSIDPSPAAVQVALERLVRERAFKSAAIAWREIAEEHRLDRFVERLSEELALL